MKFLYNPEEGAPIKDVWYKKTRYFPQGEEFKVNSVVQIDDEIADLILSLFEFIHQIDAKTAKEIIAKPPQTFKCEKCEYKTDKKIGLLGHMRGHPVDAEIIEGIAVIRKMETDPVDGADKKSFDQKQSEEDRAAGLEGEGLVIEKPAGRAVMH